LRERKEKTSPLFEPVKRRGRDEKGEKGLCKRGERRIGQRGGCENKIGGGKSRRTKIMHKGKAQSKTTQEVASGTGMVCTGGKRAPMKDRPIQEEP